MRRFRSKVLAAFLTGALLIPTACIQAPVAMADSSANKTITLWHIQTTSPMPSIIADSATRFEKANPGYHVKITVMQNDAFKTKLQIAMSSNTMPDIFPTWTGGPMYQYIDSKKLADLTSYMNKDNYKNMFMTGAISQATYKDKIWAVPVENVSVAMFFYNKLVFAKYNLKVPKTQAQLESICSTLKSKNVIPFSLANKTQWTGSMYYMYLVDRVGGSKAFANAVSGKGNGSFTDSTFEKAGAIIQKWVKAGYFNPGYNGLDEDSGQSRTLLYQGKAAMTLMGSWFISTVEGENKGFIKNIGSFPFPSVTGGKGDPNAVVGTVGDNFYAIASSCKDVPAAFKVCQFMIDKTAQKKRIAAGHIPPLKATKVTDKLAQVVLDAVKKAPTVQLWYDQYLPSSLSSEYLNDNQAVFGLTKTPAQADTAIAAAIKKYYKK